MELPFNYLIYFNKSIIISSSGRQGIMQVSAGMGKKNVAADFSLRLHCLYRG